jgi:N-acetylglucosaminyl-diphospho-decaprenol L-rhamnosyltransferase
VKNDSDSLVVIIVNWNSYRLVAQTIRSLFEHNSHLRLECFVVDNNSTNTEGKNDVLDLIGGNNLVENKANVGFGNANNQIMQQNQGKDFLILNPDTIQDSDAVSKAWQILKNDKTIGVVGIRHIDHLSGETQDSAFLSVTPWFQVLNILRLGNLIYKKIKVDQSKNLDVDWVVGSFMLVRGAVFDEVGGFDPSFFLNNEDIEWCSRIRNKGWRIRYLGDYSMRHIGGGTRHFMADSTLTFARSHLHYLWKTSAYMPALTYYVLMCWVFFASATRDLFLKIFRNSNQIQVRNKFKRFRDFFLLKSVEACI